MTHDEFLTESRKRSVEMQTEFVRLIRTHADTMDVVKDMMSTGRDAVATRPNLLFARHAVTEEGTLEGGQWQAAVGGAVIDGLIDLIKNDGGEIKKKIGEWVGSLFG